ncbi:MAG: hypothetical protein IPL76_15850 [Gemmatimonadetes bacterium]|nr:hypothetical protein [Gemmatimonadota bacterium]
MSLTGQRLQALVSGFRRLALASWAGGGLGLACVLLGAAAWAARLGWFGQPWWVLATWGVVLALAGAVLLRSRRQLAGLSPGWVAERLEAAGFRQGALRAHLEPAAAGTSAALLALADGEAAQAVGARGPDLLRPVLERFRRAALLGGGALVAGLLLLGSARPTHGRPALLWRPVEAWTATVAPLRLSLSVAEVDRGQSVAVTVAAPGRERAILWVRTPGESWRGQGLVLDSAGRAATSLGPLEQDLFVRVTSGGRSSDTLAVRVRLPAFLGTLALTARYPRYLGLEDEPVPTDGDTLVLPEGTRLETLGEATAALAAAGWRADAVSLPLRVDGGRFQGSFTPAGQRTWELALQPASGRPLAGDTIRIPIVVVPDSTPRVEVPVPGADTLVPLTLRVPLVVDAQDDHGLTRVTVESRRISRLGFEDPARLEVVALPEGVRDRAILPFELDLNQRGLLPGDTVRFVVHATDNAPAPHAARSREYVLRLPTLSEVREATRETSQQVSRRLDSIAQASRQLERQTEDLAQERPRQTGAESGSTDESLSFENAKRAERVAQSQEQLLREAESVREAVEALRQSAEAAGLNDPAWQQRLQEIQDQLERAITPELREQLAELQQALRDLDPERSREALERLAEAQQQLREALERSRELFKRAALEGDMANLSAEARELTQQQEQWASQVPVQDSARAAREERALAQQADSLASALQQLAQQLGEQDAERQEGVEQAAEQAQQAADQMRQAAQSASKGQKSQAQQQGREAAQKLEPVGEQLDQERQQMQEQWREEIVQALDQALADASRLAERQLAVTEALRRGEATPSVRAEQGAIEEGVERLLEQMKEVSGKNALVGQQTSVALAAGRDNMQSAREALATAAPNPREAGRRAGEAVDALNSAAHSLLRSRGSVEGAGSGSGLQEAMQQMSQMAQQQGQMGQQAGGMLPMMGQGGSQMQEQLRALGARQRAMAERLERMRAGGQIPGAAEMSQEAKDLARALEAGRLDRQTVERQERLFRRMLDAGRTLQGQQEDEKQERQSTTANGDSVRLPPSLRRRLSADESALRVPTWEELQALSPDERRRVVEYFRRLAESPEPAPRTPAGQPPR